MSPAITGLEVTLSLLAFVVIYSFVFGTGNYYILKLIAQGISIKDDKEQYYKHSIESVLMEAPAQGDQHV